MRRFKERRKHGRKVTERWLVVSARQLAKKLYPKAEFHASHGWRVRFANRAGIAPRRKTNTKQHSVFERLPLVRRFLLDLRAMLRENRVDTASQHTPKWGRFPPHLRGNFDEVPLSFCMEMNTTSKRSGPAAFTSKSRAAELFQSGKPRWSCSPFRAPRSSRALLSSSRAPARASARQSAMRWISGLMFTFSETLGATPHSLLSMQTGPSRRQCLAMARSASCCSQTISSRTAQPSSRPPAPPTTCFSGTTPKTQLT